MEKHKGFTVVELLIVIVIIGILAAISAVAYSGVQKKAKTVAFQADVRNIKQALSLYKSENGKWPICATGSDSYSLCYIDDIIPQLTVQNLPTRSSSGTRMNYVVANTAQRWAILTIGPDGRCKTGENMDNSWFDSAPACP